MEMGREDLSPICRRAVVRGGPVAFRTGEGSSPSAAGTRPLWFPVPRSHSEAEHTFPCAHTRVHMHGLPPRARRVGHSTQRNSPKHEQHGWPNPASPIQLIRIDIC